jgi:hypothetical protein
MIIQNGAVALPDNPSGNALSVVDANQSKLTAIGRWAGKYFEFVHEPIQTVFDSLREFAHDQKDTSDKVLHTVNKAIDVLEKELEKDIESGERQEIREQICSLVVEARKEAAESRIFTEGLALLGGSVALVGLGLGVMAYESRQMKKAALELEEA